MSSQRRPAKAQLRRSLSEQLRDSTAKAWDLLWRNVRERRLAGQSPPRRGRRYLPAAARGDTPGDVAAPAARRGPAPGGRLGGTSSAAAAGARRPRGFVPAGRGAPGRNAVGSVRAGRDAGSSRVQTGRTPSPCTQHLPRCWRAARGCSHKQSGSGLSLAVAPCRRRLLSISEMKRVGFASGKQAHLLLRSVF